MTTFIWNKNHTVYVAVAVDEQTAREYVRVEFSRSWPTEEKRVELEAALENSPVIVVDYSAAISHHTN